MNNYKSDYEAAKFSGDLLDPMPEGYVSVRAICKEADRDIATVLGGNSYVFRRAGITSAVYDKDFETYVTGADAEKLRAFLKGD